MTTTTKAAHTPGPLSTRQLEMLRHYHEEGEAMDFGMFRGRSHVAWHNREQVISALIRKGMIDKDQIITDTGRAAISRAEGRT